MPESEQEGDSSVLRNVAPTFSTISMKKPALLTAALLTFAAAPLASAAAPGVDNAAKPDGKPHAFTFGGVAGEQFLLDGKPLQIRSGEMHYQRIPRESWRRSVRLAKAMGLNTVATYVFWNGHERADGSFDFETGSNDLPGFLKICAEEGMWVNFRPGPYACGEWDFGGIPPRLLAHPDLKIRTIKDANWMAAQDKYLTAVAAVARPFLAKNGGPILLTQLENEYGSYQRKDFAYIPALHKFWKEQGFGPFNTSDGAGDHYLKGITQPGVAVGLDPGENDGAWAVARKHNPGVPVFSGESYPGWLRHWGEGDWKPTDKKGAIDFFMKSGKSFNLYVLHGGTNFGFTAGANGGDGGYQPDLTSYDYGSPINEQGNTTPAYDAYRKQIASYLPESQRPVEPDAPLKLLNIAPFTPVRIAGLWDNLPAPVKQEKPAFFESWGQNQGLAVYTTELPAGSAANLTFAKIADYGLVYLDGKLVATTDRRHGKPKPIAIPARTAAAKLEVLVEGMGHINFTTQMETDRKGIVGDVKLGDAAVKNWSVQALPLLADQVTGFAPVDAPSTRAGSRYRGTFKIEGDVAATFIDMSKYEKGFVWVNGHNLGRYWKVGPQLRLYCPAAWLKSGDNTVDIVDLEATGARAVRGCDDRNYSNNKATKNMNNDW